MEAATKDMLIERFAEHLIDTCKGEECMQFMRVHRAIKECEQCIKPTLHKVAA